MGGCAAPPLIIIPLQTPPPLLPAKTTHQLSSQKSTPRPSKPPRPRTRTAPFPEQPCSSSSDYAFFIDSCDCLRFGRPIHAHALKRRFLGSREFLETRLLAMYGRCTSPAVARCLFDKMPLRSIYTWAAMLTVYVDHGCHEQALLLFHELVVKGLALEFFVFPVVLKACGGLAALGIVTQLHGLLVKLGFILNLYVANALVDVYGKCGALDEALDVLHGMPERDCVSWNSIISGCAAEGMVFEAQECLDRMMQLDGLKPDLVSWSAAIGGFTQNGYDVEALELLRRMLESGIGPNAQTLASLLPACARLEVVGIGKEVHGYVVRHGLISNSFVVNGLIDVYRRCSNMCSALELFFRFSARNAVSYNTMIVGYCERNELGKAKELFDYMEHDGVKRDAISWNSMISGYNDNGKFEEALVLFKEMMEGGLEADSFTLGSALGACTALSKIRQGREMHSYAISRGLESNSFVGVELVQMYCKFQDLMAAEMVFSNIVEKDTIAWNVLISGHARANQIARSLELLSLMRKDGIEPNIYTRNGIIAGYMENGHNELALEMFSYMLSEGLTPDIFTVGMVITICSRLVSMGRGKQVHAYSIRCGYDTDVHIGAALVDMYTKCGSINFARFAFHSISQHNLVSLNSMLAGYAMHGLGEEGLLLFEQMLADGVRPDEITFLSVLSSCVHGGSVEEGCRYFDMMTRYDIKPELRHCTSMVDLFSRAGQISEAYELIQTMPMKPDVVLWGALFGGCVIHNNVKLGEVAASKLIELDEGNTANYVLLANLYGAAGKRNDLARTRQIIRNKGMHKIPGCSWIEDSKDIHVFLSNDQSHKQVDAIHVTVQSLHLHMRSQSDMVGIAY